MQFSFGSPIIVLPHIRSGRLKAIAVTSAQRMSLLPTVPTIAESGVAGYEVRIWYGVLAPAGTPKDVVAKLATEIKRITALPAMKERLDAPGMEPPRVANERYEAVLRPDRGKFRPHR